jgi:hypothetical protein
MAVLHLAYTLKSIATIVLLFKQPVLPITLKPSVNKGYFLSITMIECGMLIYANTFHYRDENVECKNSASKIKTMWILMQIELALGYITLIRSLVTLLSILYISIAKFQRNR